MGLEPIDKHPLFIGMDATIHAAIKEMIDKEKCNALVIDHDEQIVGIVTERDILRKIALLDVTDKLTYRVSTIMTRPVNFVTVDRMWPNIKELHIRHGYRHFPVLQKGKSAHRAHVVGIVTASELLKKFVQS